MTTGRTIHYKMMPAIFIVSGMALICEFVLEYDYTGHYFSMSTTGWLLFSIFEIILDIILAFVFHIAYKLESGKFVILVLSIAFGGDALFLFVGVIDAILSAQTIENDTTTIRYACNISFIYFARHFIFIVLIYIAGFNYALKASKKHKISLFFLLLVTTVFFVLTLCTSVIHSDKLTEHHDILLSSRSLFFLSGLWFSLFLIHLPGNQGSEKYHEIIRFFIISNITCNFLLVATEDSDTIIWYTGRGIENICKSVILVIIYTHVRTVLHNVIEYSQRDYLTGFFRHTIFSTRTSYLLPGINRNNACITIIACRIQDLDSLYINEGFTTGDNAVKGIANVFISNAGQMDTIIRVRENIFIMLTPFSSITTLQIRHRQIKSSIIHTIKTMNILLNVDVFYQISDLSEISLEQVMSDLTSKHQS
ncbi:TPA: MASE4 domain-containing protein [Escherichia coli]|nr:MASE4 domain-containing protein [Escherichia coli]